ncbi:MAG: efflux RND transporter permease subunit, partial [Gammaproteobacteria bacterium]
QAHLILNYDPNTALSEINTKVNAILNQLPQGSQQPVITVAIGETIDAMYIGFYSKVLPSNKITDYLLRIVQPKLQAINGVQQAEILGGRPFALRAWLDPAKLSAYNLTAADVSQALAKNDFVSASGRTDGDMVTVNLSADTGLSTVEQFKKLVLKAQNGAIIRLEDVANVSLGSVNYDTAVGFDGEPAVYIGIKIAPAANVLTVIKSIKQIFPDIQAQLPQGLNGRIVYDSSKFVKSSIHEVAQSLIEALIIVTLVIYFFLGSVRSVIIPVLAIPLSLIGTFFMMYALGYSVNLLTLLALVLAIGLVVDDAIIVLENIHRHMEGGIEAFPAAIRGARELAGPIVAISVVLVAVYLPIGFMGGLTGALFTEFAFTLAGAVAISAIIALTLSPMMCSRFLKITHNNGNQTLADFIDREFENLHQYYRRLLSSSLDSLPVTAVFAVLIFISIYFLFITAKSELAPQEDQGIIISQLTAAPNATLRQTQVYSKEVYKVFKTFPEMDHSFSVDGQAGLNTNISGMILKPWEDRKRTSNQLQPLVQNKLNTIPGAKIAAFQLPSLPGSQGLPVQFVIETTDSFELLNDVTQEVLSKALASGLFMFLDSDLKFDKAQTK